MSPFRPDGLQPPLRRRRFAYGYALDSSEFPCYLVWPQREERLYVPLDTATSDTLLLDEQSSFRPLGMQHFYDSFALISQICIRSDALELFGLRDDELLPDLHITKVGVLRAELGAHQEHLLTRMLKQLTGIKFLPQSSMWPRTRLTLTQKRTGQSLPLVTLKKVAVKVTPHRMNLPLH